MRFYILGGSQGIKQGSKIKSLIRGLAIEMIESTKKVIELNRCICSSSHASSLMLKQPDELSGVCISDVCLVTIPDSIELAETLVQV